MVKIVQVMQKQQYEYVLSKQLLRSGTAIGALQSKAEFIHKRTISLQEAKETKYWLHLLHNTHYLEKESF